MGNSQWISGNVKFVEFYSSEQSEEFFNSVTEKQAKYQLFSHSAHGAEICNLLC